MPFRLKVDCDWPQQPPERTVKAAAILSASVATAYGLNALRQRWNRTQKAEKKRRECAEAKSKLQKHLDDHEREEGPPEEVTDLSFEELRGKLRSGDLDPVTVLRAYQRKALAVDRRLNCLIEPIAEAENWARNCKRGALYGVPVSLKDILPIKGYEYTFGGCVNVLGQTHAADAVFVEVLKKQGAIPFVITNGPQTLLSIACTNPIFGFTGNPYNPERTPGGSSGGEAALIGAGGSVLGMGNDIGGSVRIPAAFCGICSIKPTSDRYSYRGCITVKQNLGLYRKTKVAMWERDAIQEVRPVNGPMTRDVDTLVEYMRIICAPEIWELDPMTIPVSFREEIYSGEEPLRVGYYCDDGYYPAIPAYHRAIAEVKVILENQGHTLVPFQVPDVAYAMEDLYMPAVFADCGPMMREMLEGDEVIEDLMAPGWALRLNPSIQRLIGWIWGFWDRTQGAAIRSLGGVRSVMQWLDLTEAIRIYRNRVITEWQDAKLDCVLCPPNASVGLPDKITGKIGMSYSYTCVYNLLDFPAGIVPVTRVTPGDVSRLSEYVPQTYGQRILKKAMVGSEGLPVGVQCAALPNREELVLRLMKAVETGVRQKGGPGV